MIRLFYDTNGRVRKATASRRRGARPATRGRTRATSRHAQSAATDDHLAHAPLPPPNTRAYVTTSNTDGETLNGQRLIEFRLGAAEASDQLRVLSAELMVRAETEAGLRPPPRYTLWAFSVPGRNASAGTLSLAGAARRDPTRAWQRLDVTAAARRWARESPPRPLSLLLDCSGCAGRVRLRLGGGQAARPLLRLRVAAAPTRRRRRALDCASAPRGHCCRQTYYVSFRSLGWDDWIVAPEGYHANYCRGACVRGFSLGNNHAQVAEAAQLQRTGCCAPLRFSALSLIYFGESSNIIKRDLPEMVVEECGCP